MEAKIKDVVVEGGGKFSKFFDRSMIQWVISK